MGSNEGGHCAAILFMEQPIIYCVHCTKLKIFLAIFARQIIKNIQQICSPCCIEKKCWSVNLQMTVEACFGRDSGSNELFVIEVNMRVRSRAAFWVPLQRLSRKDRS